MAWRRHRSPMLDSALGLLAALALCGGCGAASAREEEPAIASRYRCDPGSSVRTTVAQIRAAPRRLVGRCVTLTAPSNGYALYESREELERFEHSEDFRRDVRMIGVYLPPDIDEGRELVDRNLMWTVTGRLDSCERIWSRTRRSAPPPPRSRRSSRIEDADPIVIVSVPGYCHSRHGPVLSAHAATVHLD